MNAKARKHSATLRAVRFARQCGAGMTVAQVGAVIRLHRLYGKSDAVKREMRRYAQFVGAMNGKGVLSWGLLDEMAAYGI